MQSNQTAADSSNARTRQFSWSDVANDSQKLPLVSGLEAMQAIVDGDHPRAPSQDLLGVDLVAVSEGEAVFKIQPAEYHANPMGHVHGGIVATALDFAMGAAVHTRLPKGVGYATLEMKVNLVRPVLPTTPLLTATGKTVHFGSKTATAEAELTDESGKLYAHATSTCLVVSIA